MAILQTALKSAFLGLKLHQGAEAIDFPELPHVDAYHKVCAQAHEVCVAAAPSLIVPRVFQTRRPDFSSIQPEQKLAQSTDPTLLLSAGALLAVVSKKSDKPEIRKEKVDEVVRHLERNSFKLTSPLLITFPDLTESERIEIAKIAAAQDGGRTTEYIQNYGITDQSELIEIAKIAVAQDSSGISSSYIQNYGITDQKELIKIAKIVAAHHGDDISFYIQNYGITDQQALIEIAKIAAAQDGGRTTEYIQDYGITDKADLIQIAAIAANSDLSDFQKHFHKYGFTFDDSCEVICQCEILPLPLRAVCFDRVQRESVVFSLWSYLVDNSVEYVSITSLKSEQIIFDILGIAAEVDQLKWNQVNEKDIGDFYDLAFDLDSKGLAGIFSEISVPEVLYSSHKNFSRWLSILEILRNLCMLDQNSDMSQFKLSLDWVRFKELVESGDFVAAEKILKTNFEQTLKKIFDSGKLDFKYDDIECLQKMWGNIDPILTLLVRYHGNPDWQGELHTLGTIFKSILSGQFEELKFGGSSEDDFDKEKVTQQLRGLDEAGLKVWKEQPYRVQVVEAASDQTVSAEQVFVDMQQIISTNLLPHFKFYLELDADEKVAQTIQLAETFDQNQNELFKALAGLRLFLKPKTTDAKISVQQQAQARQILTDIDDLQKCYTQSRQLVQKQRAFEEKNKALVFVHITHDPYSLLTIGDAVDTSSCQNYKAGSHIQTLPGYVMDANVKVQLGYVIDASIFKTLDEFNRVYQVVKNNGDYAVQFDEIRRVWTWRIEEAGVVLEIETRSMKKAHLRHVLKRGTRAEYHDDKSSLFRETQYHNIPFARAELEALAKDQFLEFANKMKAETSGRVRIAASRNPCGVYSDAAGGVMTSEYFVDIEANADG